jgi:glycosyltransferase involved in cell wall biosynthesis
MAENISAARTARRRVLMVSPHFPPDSGAASHRVRLLAPHLAEFGWQPTVVTVQPEAYEGRLDQRLLNLVPATLDVVRSRAWTANSTRWLGIGDLGLRAFAGLYRACSTLLSREKFDVLFITVYPVYPALLGPLLKRRFGVRFVLDYQDPWVGSWGLTVGSGANGTADLKSRLTRAAGLALEPLAVRSADGLTAVSQTTYSDVLDRIAMHPRPACAALPLGWEAHDFDGLPPSTPSTDDCMRLRYVGTLLPNGLGTLRALLAAVRQLRDAEPDAYARLRLEFVGTSNQSTGHLPQRVIPIARELGVESVVTEVPERVPYADALSLLTSADGILLLGSSERHYTASKVYPALVARRPILALFHADSSVTSLLRDVGTAPSIRLVTYSDSDPGCVPSVSAIFDQLVALLKTRSIPADIHLDRIESFSARAIAGRLAAVFNDVCVAR